MNDQRRVIFSQRLKILKNKDIEKILHDFLEEIIENLENVKNIYQKSNDKKSYLASLKNITGNILNDEELLSISSFNKIEFSRKIKDVYFAKTKERIDIIGKLENNNLEKKIFLQVIDFSWRSHLQYLEQLRQVIGLRSYGQKDPLSEFKKEAFTLFEGLLDKIKTDIIKFLLNLNIVVSDSKEQSRKIEPKVKSENKKIGRNEKCTCGSGKKYKHCCGLI